MDELTVLAEYADPGAAGPALEAIRAGLQAELNTTLGIRANVQMKAPGELERTQFKARRVIDERNLYGSA